MRRPLVLLLLPTLALLSSGTAATATDGVDPCTSAGGTPGHSATVKYLLTCTFTTPGTSDFTVPAGATSCP